MTTSITLRATKGSALTHAEMDANLTNLQTTADQALAASDTLTADKAEAAALGVNNTDLNMGSFTGSTISDNVSAKAALQELETAVETKANASALGVTASAANMGTFTGTTIADNQTAKVGMQSLETAVETKATAAALGVTATAANMGTYTGSTISDNQTAKQNLQEIETAVEVRPTSATLAASGGSALLGFLQSGTGAVARTAQAKMRDVVSVTDFGAVGSGDETTKLQAAIEAAIGHTLYIPYSSTGYTHTGLTIAGPITILGETSPFDTSASSTLICTADGVGVHFYAGASTKLYNPVMRNVRLLASGSATSGSSAVGLKLTNVNYGLFENVTVRGFQGGVGILATATNGQIGASNTFIGNMLWNNLVGYKFDGAAAGSGDFASNVYGGAVIGITSGTANSKGAHVTQYAAETVFWGVDFETAAVLVDLYGNGTTNGGGVKLIGCRTEFEGTWQIRVNSTTDRTQIIGHRFAGGSVASWLSDSGVRTMSMGQDGNIRLYNASLEFLNNIPVNMQDSGGTARQILKMASNDTLQIGQSAGNGNYPLGRWYFGSGAVLPRSAPTYGTTVSINAALGNAFTITATDGVGFTISSPTNGSDGQQLTIIIRNTSGGALGAITWGANYKMAAWTSPATGNSRSISFCFDGTNWIESGRASADVPN